MTEVPSSRRCRHHQRAANQGCFEDSARIPRASAKNRPDRGSIARPGSFSESVRPGCNGCRDASQMPEPGRIGPNCLECAAIFGHLPLTIRCRLGDHTRAMMIRRILTICAAVTAGAAWASFAQAQSYPVQSYPPPPGATSSPYPTNGAAADYRRAPGAPDFDSLQDNEEQQGSAALSPPGPVMSPDDPRYGRPTGAPVYSDRNAPTGPVMSPDDPRYGRPSGPPPVIYSDRNGRPADDG